MHHGKETSCEGPGDYNTDQLTVANVLTPHCYIQLCLGRGGGRFNVGWGECGETHRISGIPT